MSDSCSDLNGSVVRSVALINKLGQTTVEKRDQLVEQILKNDWVRLGASRSLPRDGAEARRRRRGGQVLDGRRAGHRVHHEDRQGGRPCGRDRGQGPGRMEEAMNVEGTVTLGLGVTF